MKRALPYILIAILLLLAAGFYIDKTSETELLPQDKQTTSTKTDELELKNYGPAPDFIGVTEWLNTEKPLSIQELKGKVVLVDFWTYSCINCIRTLPYVTKWYDTYKDQGLVVVGVHTPEFVPERVTENVERAIKQYNIHYPVAQDNDYRTWNAYKNNSWPAKYLIDQNGTVVNIHIGEGDYEETEQLIRKLLGLDINTLSLNPSPIGGGKERRPQTPEIYFGLSRLEYFGYNTRPDRTPKEYTIPNRLDLHEFALEGTWQFNNETATLIKGPGKIKLHFLASKVYMVASSNTPAGKEQSITAKVDNLNSTIINISDPTLYTVFDSELYGEHTLEVTIPKAGFEAYTFTFGQ